MLIIESQFGLEELKFRSLAAIRGNMSRRNIVQEAFSQFTSRCVHYDIDMDTPLIHSIFSADMKKYKKSRSNLLP
jgi:hypothetical protein